MRIVISTIVAAGMMLAAAPARAQAYNPNYPVCLQAYGPYGGAYIECAYTSLPQCAASASGRAAQCIVNPFFVRPMRGRAYPQQRRVY